MNRKILIVCSVIGLMHSDCARAYFFIEHMNEVTTNRQSISPEVGIFRAAGFAVNADSDEDVPGLDRDESAHFRAAIEGIRHEIGKANKSNVLPQQCFAYSGHFELDGHQFFAKALTNQINATDLEWLETEKAKGRKYRVAGVMGNHVDMKFYGRESWRVSLHAEVCHDDAIEIAISRTLFRSSLPLNMSVKSIVVNAAGVGDFCLYRKADDENLSRSFLAFVRGGCAVVVCGSDALRAARLVDDILMECGRAYERGEIITIATAAERLSKKLNSEGVRSVASKRSTE